MTPLEFHVSVCGMHCLVPHGYYGDVFAIWRQFRWRERFAPIILASTGVCRTSSAELGIARKTHSIAASGVSDRQRGYFEKPEVVGDRRRVLSTGFCSSRGDDSGSVKIVAGSEGGEPHTLVEGGAWLT
ncbi:hypothetical protein RHMOL_Rhmol11G0093000 [Rhododendron molle]|uniref:Uncharacterized protein n=1 Tax=Rhododendron molle TaxID=49168 RepID=A0ACC0LPZ2_RHOML|nr:hypothetical protein RHMOL_Rhmol11G0093000 [Rhododendron molle]